MLCCDSSPATSMPVFEAKLLASLTETCITQEWFSGSHISNQHRHIQLLASASASTALPATVCCLESWEAAAEDQALIPYNPLLVFLMALSNKGQDPCTPAQEPANQGPTFETASTASAVRGAFLAGKLLALVGLHTHSDQEAAFNILQCIFTASKGCTEHICSRNVLPSEANETSMLLSLLVQSSLALARQALKQPQMGTLLTYRAATLTCDLLQSLMQPGSYAAARIAGNLYLLLAYSHTYSEHLMAFNAESSTEHCCEHLIPLCSSENMATWP